jgi:hypothetical protein
LPDLEATPVPEEVSFAGQAAEDKPQLRFAEEIMVNAPSKPGAKSKKKKKQGVRSKEGAEDTTRGARGRRTREFVEDEDESY